MVVQPIGYNESTLVHIHSKCGCSCGATQRCHDYQQQDHLYQAACSGLQGSIGGGEGVGCRAEGSEVDCSGRGVCECGRCVCEQSKLGAVYGKHCEVDDFSCPYEGGRMCAGEGMEEMLHIFLNFFLTDLLVQLCVSLCLLCVSMCLIVCFCLPGKGECVCGQCMCDDGWGGNNCGCSASTARCLSADGSICSGRGRCECGRCLCDDLQVHGDLCEKCPACQSSCQSNWYLLPPLSPAPGCWCCCCFKQLKLKLPVTGTAWTVTCPMALATHRQNTATEPANPMCRTQTTWQVTRATTIVFLSVFLLQSFHFFFLQTTMKQSEKCCL